MIRNLPLFLIYLFVSVGCMSTRVAISPKWDPHSKPAYVDYFDYYLFGFMGRNSVSLQKACVDQKPLAFERIRSIEDGIIAFWTLGIYSPMTVKVWCGD